MTTAVMERRRSSASAREPHDSTVNVRMSSATKELIDSAAAVIGKNRSDFITESAREHAVNVLLDQRLFVLNTEAFASFERALDNPPPPNDKLKALLRRTPLWEK
jgi:uncharacterized protein (DUF1778 family)